MNDIGAERFQTIVDAAVAELPEGLRTLDNVAIIGGDADQGERGAPGDLARSDIPTGDHGTTLAQRAANASMFNLAPEVTEPFTIVLNRRELCARASSVDDIVHGVRQALRDGFADFLGVPRTPVPKSQAARTVG